MSDVAKRVGEALQKDIHYIEETVEEAYSSRRNWPAQPWEYDSWVSTYTAIASGELEAVSHDIETILGRKATSLETFLKRQTAESILADVSFKE